MSARMIERRHKINYMKSFETLAKRMMKRLSFEKDNRGIFGLDAIKVLIVSLLTIGLLAIVVIYIVWFLVGTTSIFPTGSAQGNATLGLANNMTAGISQFIGSYPTFFAVAVLLVILLILGALIAAVYLFTRGGSGGGQMVG